MKEYFAHVSRTPHGLSLNIFIGYMDNKDCYILRNNKMVKVDPLEPEEPTIKMNVPFGEQKRLLGSIVDGLIEYGIKPSEKLPDSSELTAVKFHLEDMRKIVFEDNKD